ncbi:hypothetical protein [Pragia fontium]|uniref:hypothetical protein n=1 Tax=Pragia fontium TaxID=82985 RepID=UPI00064B00B5|nr:hypothetical protein [Pragia fontium]AKJ42085.1 hypothetical protein QQ39_08270 [Pragia fontium]
MTSLYLYRNVLRNLLVITASITLMACSSVNLPIFSASRVQIRSIELSVTDKVNEGRPLHVDFVAVNGDHLTKQLENLTSAQWFADKQRWLKQNPGKLFIWPVNIVADSHTTIKDIPLYGRPASKVIIFADYQSKGAHRLELDHTLRHPKLEFRNDDAYLFE